jgi:hypothetical protein
MKRLSALLFLVVASLTMLSGCFDYNSNSDYSYERPAYVAVKMKLSDVRSSLKIEGPTALEKPGKIYVKDNALFVNERGKGVHIFDNTDPSHPVNLSFISILGNQDMSVKDNILYADNTIDLVAIDIADPHNPQFVKRLEKALPPIVPTDQPIIYGKFDPNTEVVVEWKDTTFAE